MPIGYFKAVPKVDIQFEDRQYRVGDQLKVTISMHTERPGIKVRRAVVELALENRYTHTRIAQGLDRGAYGSLGANASAPMIPSPFSRGRVTEERIDRMVQGREELIMDGVLRQRTQLFRADFIIKPPPVRRTMERRATYQLLVHMDLPRMRDVEIHRSVPVQLT